MLKHQIFDPIAYFLEIWRPLAPYNSCSYTNTLFKAAANLAEISAAGHLPWPGVEEALTDAALQVGLDPREISKTIDSAWRKGSSNPRSPKPMQNSLQIGSAEITEDKIALDFAENHGAQFRFDHDQADWFNWTGDHWQQDAVGTAIERLRKATRMASDAAAPSVLRRVRSRRFISGAEALAKSDPRLAVQSGVWDQDPFLLGCPGGTIDLKTGEICTAQQSDMITQQVVVKPSDQACCSLWLNFLIETTGGDLDMIRFLQQIAGYCLTDSTNEHALFFLYGPGGNGKSVFLNTLTGIVADYAKTATMSAFTASKHERHTTELAMLRGARLVTASESEQGQAWAESRIKALTGGDPITARLMRQDNFTYLPKFKLLIAGNHKPQLVNVDDAAKRRFIILPFTHKPANPDPDLEEKLKAEWPSILRWMIAGALDWQQNGLMRPEAVISET